MSSPSPSPAPAPGVLHAWSAPPPGAAQIPELTLSHLLSLPPLLHPLSPPLAALHLARLRLLLSVPATPSYRAAGGLGLSGWCHLCGGLRSGQGGAERRGVEQDQAGGASSPKSTLPSSRGRGCTKGRGRGRVKGKARLAKGETEGGIQEDGVNVFGTSIRAPEDIHQRNSTSPSPPSKKRKKAECDTCGVSYKRPRPDPITLQAFPSARRTRSAAVKSNVDVAQGTAEPSASAAASGSGIGSANVNVSVSDLPSGPTRATIALKSRTNEIGPVRTLNDEAENQIIVEGNQTSLPLPEAAAQSRADPTPSTTTHTSTGLEPLSSSAAEPTESSSLPDQQQSKSVIHTQPPAHAQPLPTLLSRPSLSHIPSSSPNLPTYPPPPPATRAPSYTTSKSNSTSNTGSGTTGKSTKSAGTSSTSASAHTGAGKRKKKSGLAKLLAENKERELASKSSGGMWGL